MTDSKMTEIVATLVEKKRKAEEKYREQLAKEFPRVEVLWTVPIVMYIVSFFVGNLYLPDSMILPKGGEFGRSFPYDFLAFFVPLLLITYWRDKNGADYLKLSELEREMLLPEVALNELLYLETKAHLADQELEHAQLKAELAQAQVENEELKRQLP